MGRDIPLTGLAAALELIIYGGASESAVHVAQVAEHRIVIPRVVGSSPIMHPIFLIA